MPRLSALAFLLFFISVHQLFSQENYLLVGTYNSPNSEGIYVYRFNSNDGSSRYISHVKTFNPSYLAVSPDEKFIYSVNEKADSKGKGGTVSSFSFNKQNGTLTFIDQRSSMGNNPCYIATDSAGSRLMVVNYSSGDYTGYSTENGRIDTAHYYFQRKGSGPDSVRQRSSHLHGIFWSGENVYITDLGADEIICFTGYPGENVKTLVYRTKRGAGPRHLAFNENGKFIYSLNELNSTVEVFKQGNTNSIQTISSLPRYSKVPGGCADIHISPDGKFLYVSNRGSYNSIGIYAIDEKTGLLIYIDHVNSGGLRPRNFNFDPSGNFLLVGNQMSDEIAIFKRDKESGLLRDTKKRIKVGRPVCLKWISTN